MNETGRVLIIAAMEIHRNLLLEILGSEFPQVSAVANCRQALRTIANDPVDLVVMDHHQQARLDLDAYRTILALAASTPTILLVSARPHEIAAQVGKEEQYAALLRIPYKQASLLDTVRRSLDEHPSFMPNRYRND